MPKEIKDKSFEVYDKIAKKYPELNTSSPELREIVRAHYEIEIAKQARVQMWIIVVLTATNIILTFINLFS